MTDPDQTQIDKMLAQAAAQRPPVPSDLMARIMIDAVQTQVRADAPTTTGIWRSMLELIGGWPSVGGLAMAGIAGVWIGIAPPLGLEGMATTVLGSTQTIDLFGGDTLGNFSDGLDG
jgi:hypothetical protein